MKLKDRFCEEKEIGGYIIQDQESGSNPPRPLQGGDAEHSPCLPDRQARFSEILSINEFLKVEDKRNRL